MAITDLLTPVTSSASARPATDTLAAPGYTHGATSATLSAGTNWADGVIYFTIYTTTTIGSTVVKDPTTQTDWKATKSGTSLTNMTLTGGSATQDYVTGAIVELTPTSRYAYDLYQWGTAHGNLDGSLKATAIQTALGLGSASLNGWNPLGYTFSSVTALGNRSYLGVVSGVDVTGTISNGMRLLGTRTVAAPTQSTSLNGTTQYWTKASPTGMTATDNITVIGWIKPSAYQQGVLVARANGTTDGWQCYLGTDGRINFGGARAADDVATSYQSVPLNKWVHVAATINSAGAVATMYLDGASIPVSYANNANSGFLTPTGTFSIGASSAGASPFAGKIAQMAVFNAVLSQATIQGYMSQGLSGAETSEISAYSFNGNANDLNANANNLTANGAATATNADSFSGTQADGTVSSTKDYAIVTKTAFSTNSSITFQVPEGNTWPTSGGVSAVSYASVKAPYGFPAQREKWRIKALFRTIQSLSTSSLNIWNNIASTYFNVPIGDWTIGHKSLHQTNATSGDTNVQGTLSNSNSSESDVELTGGAEASNVTVIQGTFTFDKGVSLSVATNYYLLTRCTTAGGGFNTLLLRGDAATIVLQAEPGHL